MTVRYGLAEKTAILFILKVRKTMTSNWDNLMTGSVDVDEFVVGEKDEGYYCCTADRAW